MSLRLSVIGTGYLGAAHAACLAGSGFDVLGVDADPARVRALAAGRPPLAEPGLPEAVRRGLAAGRLAFTSSLADAARTADVHFVCVGTPPRPEWKGADLSQLYACVDELAPMLRRPCLVVGKSTTPAGTAAALARRLADLAPVGARAELAWNPEFLREGHALADTAHPDRIVVGVSSARAEAALREVYADQLRAGCPMLVTDLATAELVKLAANAFLATKLSFINAMAEVCDTVGADVVTLADALGHDGRIGPGGMRPGLGYGGSCLPKDLRAFAAGAEELGAGAALAILREVDAINARCRDRAVRQAARLCGGTLAGRKVAVLGAAFKGGSDDIRDSPALSVAAEAHRRGAVVTVYDPAALRNARMAFPELRYATTAAAAVAGADLLCVLTDWQEFRELDPAELGEVAAHRTVLDTRHVLDPERWRQAGWRYRAPGRPATAGPARRVAGQRRAAPAADRHR